MVSPSIAALHRLQSCIADASQAIEAEQQQYAADLRSSKAYDQGRIDERTRIMALISLRLDAIKHGEWKSIGTIELRLLRDAILEHELSARIV